MLKALYILRFKFSTEKLSHFSNLTWHILLISSTQGDAQKFWLKVQNVIILVEKIPNLNKIVNTVQKKKKFWYYEDIHVLCCKAC